MSTWRVRPGGQLSGSVTVPGDKSISHRAVLIGALAEGETVIHNLLWSEDVRATVAAVRALGIKVDADADGAVRVHGRGLHGLHAPVAPIDCGNAGTAMRLLAGVLAAQPFASELRGDASLMARPMERVAAPLRAMGADISTAAGGVPPIHIGAATVPLRGMSRELLLASAQVKSALLLAGLYADAPTTVCEYATTRNHTELMLHGFNADIKWGNYKVTITPGTNLRATTITVPNDISAAAFFIVGAAISAGSKLTVNAIGMNDTRNAIVNIMRNMGASITDTGTALSATTPNTFEYTADITVCNSALKGIPVNGDEVVIAMDEVPAIAIAAAAAEGKTIITGASELRVKESDRIATVVAGLKAIGVTVSEWPDGMTITGVDAASGGRIPGGTVDSGGDHRIAMAFAMAATIASGDIIINDCDNVATSFPDFIATAAAVGLHIDECD